MHPYHRRHRDYSQAPSFGQSRSRKNSLITNSNLGELEAFSAHLNRTNKYVEFTRQQRSNLKIESPVRRSLNPHLQESFIHVQREAGESEWAMFRAFIVVAADRCCRHKVVVACCGGNARTRWWTTTVRDSVRLKKESYQALLTDGTSEAAARYQQAKRCAATVVAEAKTWAWEEFGDAMENDFRKALKRFWITMQCLRVGKQGTINTVYSGDGALLTLLKHVVEGLFQSPDRVDRVTGFCNIAWPLGVLPLYCRPGWSSLCLRRDYREITLLSLPRKVYSGVLERRVCRIIKPQIQEEQCGFRLRHGTVEQLYTLSTVLEGAWKLAQPVHMCCMIWKRDWTVSLSESFWGFSRIMGCRVPIFELFAPRMTGVRVWSASPAVKSYSFPVRVGSASAHDFYEQNL